MLASLKVVKFALGIYPLLNQGQDLELEYIRSKSIAFRDMLQNFGPTYIKLGQMLSVRYDLLHKQTCLELQQLLDSGEPVKFSQIRKIIKKELPQNHDKLLKRMDRDPLAVASIGQVHLAYIGKHKVAVKIQKPGVYRDLTRDISALKNIIATISILPILNRIQLREVISEFEQWTLREVDYSIEATNTENFKHRFSDDRHLYIPEVFREYSTDKILVTEFVEGASVKDLMEIYQYAKEDKQKLKGETYSRDEITHLFAKNLYRQIFVEGLVHGDPHPSNMKLKDPDTICYIDFGIVAKISPAQLKLFKQITFDLASQNYESMVEGMLLLDQKEGARPKEEIMQKVMKNLEKFDTSLAEEYGPTKVLSDIMFTISSMGVQLPMYLVLMGKVLATYDGILQIIDPKASMMQIMLPYFEEFEMKDKLNEFKPDVIAKELYKHFNKYMALKDVILSMPEESIKFLHDMQVNGIKINTYSPPPVKTNDGSFKLFALLGLAFMMSAITLISLVMNQGQISLLFIAFTVIIFIVTLYYILKD